MTLPEIPSRLSLCELVVSIAEQDKDLLAGGIAPEHKSDGSYVTTVDRNLQQAFFSRLSVQWPQYGFIGEEMDHAEQVRVCKSSVNGYWVVDPLDGTTNFTAGFLCFGVSLALVVDGQPILAVIYDPVRKECFSAEAGKGAYMNNTLIRSDECVTELEECIANVDYKRLVGELAVRLVRSPPYRSQRNLGSSVLEWCWLAAGRVQLYLHGGQKLWDFAAGYLILVEAGGAATSLSGMPLDCASLRKRSVIAASNPALLSQWSSWIDLNRFDSESPL